MDNILIEQLLNDDESSTLDFKRDQYPFIGATDEQKGELLKDILIFANAWKRTDAYILIGVEEVKGGRSIVVGVSNHPDDASLQQFVNSKTNRPVVFSYSAFTFEGKQLGIIQIPPQERPLFLKKPFGTLKSNTVYMRSGSSTSIANPDEIARMGKDNALQSQLPTLDLQFADVEQCVPIGCNIQTESTFLEISEKTNFQHLGGLIRFLYQCIIQITIRNSRNIISG